MKGFTLERDLMVKVVLMVVVLAVVAGLVYMIIMPAAQEQSLRTSIARLCPEWVARNCDFNKAFDTSIEYKSKVKTLAELCAEDFGGNTWDANSYAHCKSLCVGCPK